MPLAVVKISSKVCTDSNGFRIDLLRQYANITVLAKSDGWTIIWVVSGAIAGGEHELGIKVSHDDIVGQQGAAAVGQVPLMTAWMEAFRQHRIKVGQLLLIYPDLSQRGKSVRATVEWLWAHNVVILANENDPVRPDEILEVETFGDNARLALLFAQLAEADLLVLLGAEPGVRKRDPRVDPEAEIIPVIRNLTAEELAQISPAPSGTGRGGMQANVAAAWEASEKMKAIIADGREPKNLLRIFRGEDIGTIFPSRTSHSVV